MCLCLFLRKYNFQLWEKLQKNTIFDRYWLKAVSYTHLDVYKRQVLYDVNSNEIRIQVIMVIGN